ncbi:MAG: hypothetical protein OXI25_03840 [Chloroflexota bacterium]|nr:hypothetical protein [Chloroflexota bacterium]
MAKKKEQAGSSQISFGDVAKLIRWVMDMHLDFIEAVASDPQAFALGAPGLDEALERWRNPRVRKGREEADTMLLTLTQEVVLEWWRGFPQCDLLTSLVRRAKRRRAKCGTPNQRRLPDQKEGRQIARPILGGVVKKSQFSFSQEAEAVAARLAEHHMPPFTECSSATLSDYVRRSSGNRTYFDALEFSFEEFNRRGMPIPCEIAEWRQQIAAGERQPPSMKRISRGRQRIAIHPVRDLQIQLVIKLLDRLGIPPRGRDFSGCRIAAEIVGVSEDTAERIWKHRIWTPHFAPILREHSKAIAQRTGPFHSSPASEH